RTEVIRFSMFSRSLYVGTTTMAFMRRPLTLLLASPPRQALLQAGNGPAPNIIGQRLPPGAHVLKTLRPKSAIVQHGIIGAFCFGLKLVGGYRLHFRMKSRLLKNGVRE